MKNRHLNFVLVIMAVLFVQTSMAQSEKKEKKEIIIREGVDSSKKMIVVVNGDKVTVNGKEVTGDEKNNFIIKRKKSTDVKNVEIIVDEKQSGQPHVRIFKGEDVQGEEIEQMIEDALDKMKQSGQGAQLGVLLEENEKGVLVKEVVPNSAAQKAGIKVNDIITSIDDKKISNAPEVVSQIKSKKPGDNVTMQIIRDGVMNQVSAKLGGGKNMPTSRNVIVPGQRIEKRIIDGRPAPSLSDAFDDMEGSSSNLAEAFDIFDQLRVEKPKLGIEIQDTEEENGVKVLEVAEGSSAAKAGLKKDDIILSIGGKKITAVSDAKESLKEIKGNSTMEILREGKPKKIEFKMPRLLKKASL
jgi:serine protease Do